MSTNAGLFETPWWRFDRYELRGGYICPARDAKLVRYSPWADYEAAHAARREHSEPPYQPLLALVKRIRLEARLDEPGTHLDSESAEALLVWCAQFGLLGVVLQRTDAVFLAPRWEPLNDESLQDEPLYPSQIVFRRTNTGWSAPINQGLLGPQVIGEPEREGELVDFDDLPIDSPFQGAVVHDLRRKEFELQPISKYWAQYFPDIPLDQRETFSYPTPLTEEFWRQYAEPVGEFIIAANALRNALELLTHLKPSDEATEKDEHKASAGLDRLHALLAPASLALQPMPDGSLRQRWTTPSLLCAFAMMAFQDLAERRRVRRCDNCGDVYTSPAWQSKFCSVRCRNTAQKRVYRERQRQSVGRT